MCLFSRRPSRQAQVTGVNLPPPRYKPSFFIAQIPPHLPLRSLQFRTRAAHKCGPRPRSKFAAALRARREWGMEYFLCCFFLQLPPFSVRTSNQGSRSRRSSPLRTSVYSFILFREPDSAGYALPPSPLLIVRCIVCLRFYTENPSAFLLPSLTRV